MGNLVKAACGLCRRPHTGDPWRPMETHGDHGDTWKSWIFEVLWIFYFFVGVLGFKTGSMTFLTLLASFLVQELLKMVG